MFTKILIANRGEIAVRVAFAAAAPSASSPSPSTSTADAGSLHVRRGRRPPSTSATARPARTTSTSPRSSRRRIESGAQAIHPGYGFLSENAGFAGRRCGGRPGVHRPSAHAMSTMGEKVAARDVAIRVQVPLAPGTGAITSAADVVAFGAEHGYPVLVKAISGGGGRGMRWSTPNAEAEDAFAAAVREATAAFGNGEVYLERYLTSARHVEVQVFADTHGNAVYVGDRDCSVQRRHQKLIEESPAPGLSDGAPRRPWAKPPCGWPSRSVTSAPAPSSSSSRDEKFYFLEMNTRIQVEHPVTEMVHGVDLIAEQIRVAAGEQLSITEQPARPTGAAIEARINAEDVAEGLFLPAPGPWICSPHPTGEGLRFDAGYESGDDSAAAATTALSAS